MRSSARARPGAGLVVLPGALPARLPGRGPLSQAPLRRGQRAPRSRRLAAGVGGITALVGFAEPVRRRRPSAAPTPRPTAPGAQRARRAARRPRSRPSIARTGSPTTASSTRCATSSPAPQPAVIEVDGVRVGLTICEDLWEPGPPASLEAERGRAADRQRLRLAVPARQGRRPRADVRRAGPRLRGPDRVLQPRRRPGRARLRRPQLRRRRERRGGRPRAAVRARPAALGAGRRRPGPARAAARRPRRGLRGARRSGSATTRARTASSGSWSGSRAGSTRRWSP